MRGVFKRSEGFSTIKCTQSNVLWLMSGYERVVSKTSKHPPIDIGVETHRMELLWHATAGRDLDRDSLFKFATLKNFPVSIRRAVVRKVSPAPYSSSVVAAAVWYHFTLMLHVLVFCAPRPFSVSSLTPWNSGFGD